MIVNTMTLKEVREVICNDYYYLLPRIDEEVERARRKFIKAVIYPIFHRFKWKSKENNTWHIILAARYRNERKSPIYIPYLKYEATGIGAYYPKKFNGGLMIFDYRPHFFRRYRERFLIPNGIENLTFDEQIEHFFMNSGLFGANFGDGVTTEYVGYTENGILLGTIDREAHCICVKTYVSMDMLFDEQFDRLDYFSEIRKKILAHPEYFKERGTHFKLGENKSFYNAEHE